MCVILALAVAATAGCGGSEIVQRAPVSGYVSIDGTPLKSGSIRFIPTKESKGPAAVAVIEDGMYELLPEAGPVVGQLRVEIDATNHFGFDMDDEQAYAKASGQGQQVAKNPVPETFNRKSILFVDMPEDGKSDLDFKLSSSGVLADSR